MILTAERISSTCKLEKKGDWQLEHVEYFWEAVISLNTLSFEFVKPTCRFKASGRRENSNSDVEGE